MVSRTALLGLVLASALACAPGGDGRAGAGIEEELDLHRHSSHPAHPDMVGVKKAMSEAKTDRVSLVPAGETLVFDGLEIPARFTLEADVHVVGAPTRTRRPLRAVVDVLGRGRGVTGATQPLGLGPDGRTLRLELAVDASEGAGRVVRGLEVRFEREDLAARDARVAVVRPVVRYEQPAPSLSGEPRRRVLLVTTDTLRADALGCYGNEVVRTPALDALADEGVLFEEAYTAANVTNPSHTSILTSLYPKDHKVEDNFTKLAPDVPTMLEPLRAAGFTTAAFVSSFNFQPEKSDLHRRFDEFRSCEIYFERRAEDVNADLLPWLREHADEDFFVWAHYFDAHMPYAPPAPYDRMYSREGDGETIDLPLDYQGSASWFNASRELSHYRALYRGEVSYLDHQLGRLFDRLRDLGVWDGTHVVVVSDHGEALGEHGVYCEHASLHDWVTRVPLLVKPAGFEGGGRRVADLVSTVDLYPTLFELCDLGLPGGLRGRSFAGAFTGQDLGRERVFSSFARGSQESLRTTDRRFLLGLADEDLFPRYSLRAGERELWDVTAPTPRAVADAEPAVAEELGRELEAFLDDTLDYEGIEIDPAAAAEMKKLGYVDRD